MTNPQQIAPPAYQRPQPQGEPVTEEQFVGFPGIESVPVEPPIPPPPRSYQWNRVHKEEFDVELPSGSFVRLRKLSKSDIFNLNIVEALDSFTGGLIEPQTEEEQASNDKIAAEAIMDPEKRGKLFNTVDRVVLAAVVSPRVVATGDTTEEQINVVDIEIDDKFKIFREAFGEQMDALKSLREEQAPVLGSVSEGEDVQPKP